MMDITMEQRKRATEIGADWSDSKLFIRSAEEIERLRAENERLWEANDAFAKRQEWWNEVGLRTDENIERLCAELAEAQEAARTWENEAERRSRRYEAKCVENERLWEALEYVADQSTETHIASKALAALAAGRE